MAVSDVSRLNTVACLLCLLHESHLEESVGRGRRAWVWLAWRWGAGRAGCGFPSTLEVREEALGRRGRAAQRDGGRGGLGLRVAPGAVPPLPGPGSGGAASRWQQLRSAAGRRLRPGQRRAAPAGECARAGAGAGAGAGAAAARAERPPPGPRGPTGLPASPPLPASLAPLCVSGSLPLRKPLS